jgi:hypothetical protein
MECHTKDMQLNKNGLENKMDEELQANCKLMAELDRGDEEAIATMIKGDKKNKIQIGTLLQSSVRGSFK